MLITSCVIIKSQGEIIMSVKIYHCKECGRTLLTIKEGTKDEFPMKELKAFAVEGAREKHIPVFEVKDGIVDVNVGSIDHPMSEEHYIEYVVLETNQGNSVKMLKPGEKPHVRFALVEGEEVVHVYAYCNLHGLWMA